ncbi:MAG: hypothetical protein A2287_02710 [Candidatus Melainabacteria bacterium RIFOXYA12_FULL_32_12]|nr:MAG: hypothetical protein A2287_02710 [Candidatus Melainabacteria bacterium RIFOXYA12_FULL_32_12]
MTKDFLEKRKNIPALIIAGMHSGAGKTSLTIGIIAALTKRGYKVQPFKVGPDFIDPGHHTKSSGRISRNLDGWMLSHNTNREIFARNSYDADIAVIEGVAGLFDGYDGISESGSTAEIAKILDVPVILVTDAQALSRSIGAVVKGYDTFDPDLKLAGVIFNKISGSRHLKMLSSAVENSSSVKIIGGIPQDKQVFVQERHLGLHMAREDKLLDDYINKLAQLAEDHLNLDELIKLANSSIERAQTEPRRIYDNKVRIGVARDEAFCFYYQDNLDLLKEYGAQIIEFSPIRDNLPENLDGIYFGGGYPELYAEQLSKNKAILEDIYNFSQNGGVIYGECGGLMYLSEGVEGFNGEFYPLCSILPFKTRMTGKVKLSYTEVYPENQIKFFPNDSVIRGHLFHYSEIIESRNTETFYNVKTFTSGKIPEGYMINNTLASYIHLHFWSNPEFARSFVEFCRGNKLRYY